MSVLYNTLVIGNFEDKNDWTVLDDATTGLADSTATNYGINCLKFDKVDGSNHKVGGASRILPGVDLTTPYQPHDRICWLVQVSDLTNVDYALIRLGTDVSNYSEWRYADTNMVINRFSLCNASFGNAYITGTGADLKNLTYMVVGVAFDAESNTLANITVDRAYAEVAPFNS